MVAGPRVMTRMSKRNPDINLHTYAATETVTHYAALNYLTPCERMLFETYIKPSSAVLDLGVGGGRTTAFLAQRASRYVGVDFIPAMVEACRKKFPALELAVADAANLSSFADASFDAVVFAFNGIDFVHPDSSRLSCFQHIRRVLRPGESQSSRPTTRARSSCVQAGIAKGCCGRRSDFQQARIPWREDGWRS